MLKPHDVLVIVGKRGSGKSHWFRTHVLPGEPRVITWDVHAEHSCDVRVTPDELPTFLGSGAGERWSVAVTPADTFPEPCAAAFTELVHFLADVGGYTLAIDEVGIIGKRAGEALEHVATQSRHYGERSGVFYGERPGVPVVFLAQRAVQVPKTAREQASRIVTFRQDNSADVDALAERIGPEWATRVWTLNRERHEFVHWREDEPTETNALEGS